ncbi:hypothetical protein IPL68_05885 [Candidatus Saccharibacteria bacterium]|nr:MAG: hypothetical protein IPL68_05885 [Candidatus Saccharibacteria bacterium]
MYNSNMEFPSVKFKPRRDSYSRTRGGKSTILYLSCSNCKEPTLVYQKDGPGKLLRCYADRILWPPDLVDRLDAITPETIKTVGVIACEGCMQVIGTPTVYRREDRSAFRVMPGSLYSDASIESAKARSVGET